MLVAYFEVAMGPEDNKPIRVTPILGTKKSPTVLYRASAGSSPGGVGSFRWWGGSLNLSLDRLKK